MDTGNKLWHNIHSLNLFSEQLLCTIVNLTRTNSVFAESSENVCNFSPQMDIIRNLCSLSHFPKYDRDCPREYHIFHTQFNHFRYYKCS